MPESNVMELRPSDREYNQVVLHKPTSVHDKTVRSELDSLCSLEQNWDGYNSPPVKFSNANLAFLVVSSLLHMFENSRPGIRVFSPGVPYFVPVSGGAVQAEWHFGNHKYVEVFVDDGETCTASYHDELNDSSEEIQINCDNVQVHVGPIANWIVNAQFAEDGQVVGG